MSTKTPVTKAKKIAPKATANENLSSSADPFLFDVDPTLEAKIVAEGFALRWINRGKYVENRGDHRGWRPYQLKVEATTSKGSLDFQYGVDPDGYISRGDLVLAVRPVAMQEANKRRIDRKNLAQQGFQAQAAAELKEKTGMKVLQGYEDEVKGYKSRGEEDIGDDE